MVKIKPEPEYEEDFSDNEGILEDDNDSLEYETHEGKGESIINKPTMDNFFNTEQLLQEIEKTMKGYQKKDGKWVDATTPKARDEFINSMINRLRSVINQQNMISYINEDDSKFLLLEKNKDFIFSVYEESSIEDEDVESIINIFDHTLQIFMGQVTEGFGARTLRQVAANVSYEIPKEQKDDGLLNLKYGNQNILKIGGRNK